MIQQYGCAIIFGKFTILGTVVHISINGRQHLLQIIKTRRTLQLRQSLIDIAQADFKAGFGRIVGLGIFLIVLVRNRLDKQGSHDQSGCGEHHHHEQNGQHHGGAALPHAFV